jgi:dolichol kinase
MAEVPEQLRLRHELIRKTIHLSSALTPLIYTAISRDLALRILLPIAAAIIAIDILRQVVPRLRVFYDRRFGHLMRSDERWRLSGASHVMLAQVACIMLYPKPVAVTALFFLSVSDALASLVGMSVRSPRWLGKSLAGSGAYLVSALGLAIICLWPHLLAAVAGAVVAMVVEALPLRVFGARVDDNLSVPLAAGAVMWLLLRAEA